MNEEVIKAIGTADMYVEQLQYEVEEAEALRKELRTAIKDKEPKHKLSIIIKKIENHCDVYKW